MRHHIVEVVTAERGEVIKIEVLCPLLSLDERNEGILDLTVDSAILAVVNSRAAHICKVLCNTICNEIIAEACNSSIHAVEHGVLPLCELYKLVDGGVDELIRELTCEIGHDLASEGSDILTEKGLEIISDIIADPRIDLRLRLLEHLLLKATLSKAIGGTAHISINDRLCSLADVLTDKHIDILADVLVDKLVNVLLEVFVDKLIDELVYVLIKELIDELTDILLDIRADVLLDILVDILVKLLIELLVESLYDIVNLRRIDLDSLAVILVENVTLIVGKREGGEILNRDIAEGAGKVYEIAGVVNEAREHLTVRLDNIGEKELVLLLRLLALVLNVEEHIDSHLPDIVLIHTCRIVAVSVGSHGKVSLTLELLDGNSHNSSDGVVEQLLQSRHVDLRQRALGGIEHHLDAVRVIDELVPIPIGAYRAAEGILGHTTRRTARSGTATTLRGALCSSNRKTSRCHSTEHKDDRQQHGHDGFHVLSFVFHVLPLCLIYL